MAGFEDLFRNNQDFKLPNPDAPGFDAFVPQDVLEKRKKLDQVNQADQRHNDMYGLDTTLAPIPQVEPPKPEPWGLGKLQKNDPVMDWIKQHAIPSFLYRTSQEGNNVIFNGGQNIPGQELVSTGNDTADKVAGFLGYGGLALNPTAGLQKAGANLASQGLSKLAPKLGATGNSLLSNAAGQAAFGAGFGAQEAAAKSQENPDYTLGHGLKDVGLNAALFGGGDLALAGLGKGLKLASDKTGLSDFVSSKLNKQDIQPKLQPFENKPVVNGAVKPINEAVKPVPQPEAAPTMQGHWFTNLFGNQGVGISAFADPRRISNMPLTTADQIVKNSIKTDTQGIKDTVAAQARATYQNFVDRLSPLNRISKDTYESAMDTARANNIANTIVRDKFVTTEGQVVGQSLEGIFKKVARGQDKSFVDYLVLRHAETRLGRGERVYAENLQMTPDKIQERLNRYNQLHPEFQTIAKEWDQFNDNVLKYYGVDGNLMTPELYKSLREQNPYYAGMRRQFTRSEKPGRNSLAKTTSSSFSGQKAPLKEVSPDGSVRNIVDPRKTAIETVGAFVNASMRNRVMVSMVDSIKQNPDAFKGIVEIVQKPKDATDLRKVLMDGGPDSFAEALNEDFQNLFKTTRVDKENIVRAMVKGQPVYLQVHDPEVVKTLIGLGPQQSNILIDVLTAFSNATKRGATGAFAPIFAVKGATMDLVQSAIQAQNPAKQAAYTVYGILSGIGDRLGIPGLRNLAQEFRRAGGDYSMALKGDRKLNTQISDMTRYPLLSPQSIGKGALNLVKVPFRALEGIGNIAENAPRMAAYKTELERLGNIKTPENIRQAMSQARESTVNWSRRGAFTHDIESLIPYNNAAIQGTYRVLKGIKDKPVRTVAAVGALAVVPKLYEYAQFHNDPDYQNLPARERSRFLIVNKNADGTFTKIPMEPAYNSIGELTIETLRYLKDHDPNAFKGTMDALANAWLPPAVTGALQGATQGGGFEKSIAGAINSTDLAPFVALTANQSFTGAPIVSRTVADRSPQYQYDERTSSVAKKLGGLTGMSPMKADYLMRSYGGDPARLLLPLTSELGSGNAKNTLLKNFVVDPSYSNTLTNDFYDAKQKLDQAYRDNKELKVPLPPWYDESLRKQLDSSANGSISKQLSSLNDQKKAVSGNNNLTDEQKTQKMRDLQNAMNKIYGDINSRLQKINTQTR